MIRLTTSTVNWPRGYKTFSMLNSAEHKLYPAHKFIIYMRAFIKFYVLLLSPYLCFISFLYIDLYALADDAWIS